MSTLHLRRMELEVATHQRHEIERAMRDDGRRREEFVEVRVTGAFMHSGHEVRVGETVLVEKWLAPDLRARGVAEPV